MKIGILFFWIFIIFIPPTVFAKKNRRTSRSRNKGKIVNINFDDELFIKGKLFGPSLFTLYQKKNVEFGKLIKPRENFLPEMRSTLGDID